MIKTKDIYSQILPFKPYSVTLLGVAGLTFKGSKRKNYNTPQKLGA